MPHILERLLYRVSRKYRLWSVRRCIHKIDVALLAHAKVNTALGADGEELWKRLPRDVNDGAGDSQP